MAYNPTPEQLAKDVQTFREANISWALKNVTLFDKPFIAYCKDSKFKYSLDEEDKLVKEQL